MEKLSKSQAKEYLRQRLLLVLKDLTKAWDPIPKRPESLDTGGYEYRPGTIQSGQKELKLGNLTEPNKVKNSGVHPFHTWGPSYENGPITVEHPNLGRVFITRHTGDRYEPYSRYEARVPDWHYGGIYHFSANNPEEPIKTHGDHIPELTNVIQEQHNGLMSQFNQANNPTAKRFAHVADEMNGDVGEKDPFFIHPWHEEFEKIPNGTQRSRPSESLNYGSYRIQPTQFGSNRGYDIEDDSDDPHYFSVFANKVNPSKLDWYQGGNHQTVSPEFRKVIEDYHKAKYENWLKNQNAPAPSNRPIELE